MGRVEKGCAPTKKKGNNNMQKKERKLSDKPLYPLVLTMGI